MARKFQTTKMSLEVKIKAEIKLREGGHSSGEDGERKRFASSSFQINLDAVGRKRGADPNVCGGLGEEVCILKT